LLNNLFAGYRPDWTGAGESRQGKERHYPKEVIGDSQTHIYQQGHPGQ
jgi:hypothetical protein